MLVINKMNFVTHALILLYAKRCCQDVKIIETIWDLNSN